MSTDISRQWELALAAEYQARSEAWSDVQDHLAFLHESVHRFPGAHVLELGVRSGVSTAALLAAVEDVGGHLWSVDLEEPRVPSWWAFTGRWSLIVGDDLAAGTLEVLPDEFDMVFLDTSHTYGHTLAELDAYVPRVRPGGLVCCHDTRLVGYDAAGMGIEGVGGQVAQALDAYCEQADLSWTNRPGSYGLGVIEIPQAEE